MAWGAHSPPVPTDTVPSIATGQEEVPFGGTVTNLGIILDSQLTFGPHINKIVKDISVVFCQLSHMRPFLTQEAVKLLVNSLVLSRMTLCPVVWGTIDQSLINSKELSTLQSD